MVMSNTQADSPQELREITLRDLRGVKLEAGRIDALALVGLAVGVANCKSQRNILCDSLQKCPKSTSTGRGAISGERR